VLSVPWTTSDGRLSGTSFGLGGVTISVTLTGTAIAGIPEPSTWAMLPVGFAWVGFMTWRIAVPARVVGIAGEALSSPYAARALVSKSRATRRTWIWGGRQAWRQSLPLQFLFKIQNVCYMSFCSSDRRGRPEPVGWAEADGALAAIRTTREASRSGEEFFSFFRCNPLKSPDSTKGIQGNASFFPWIPLDFLARDSPIGCIRGRQAARRPLR
jgi:hypothetical protein